MIQVKVTRKKGSANLQKIRDTIAAKGQEAVLSQVLGGAAALYELYPVGPEAPHIKDGTPHTRDTFAVALGDEIIATEGQFWNATSLGSTPKEGEKFRVRFLAAGAAFYLEWGTIYIEAMPLIRQFVKMTKANISNALRQINAEK